MMMTKLAKLQGAEVIAVGRNPHKKLLVKSFGHADAVAENLQVDPQKLTAGAVIVYDQDPAGRVR